MQQLLDLPGSGLWSSHVQVQEGHGESFCLCLVSLKGWTHTVATWVRKHHSKMQRESAHVCSLPQEDGSYGHLPETGDSTCCFPPPSPLKDL